MGRIPSLVKKEFLQILRDKRMLPFLLLVPLIQLILFGYAITFDIKNLPLGISDQENSALSREFCRSLENCGYFNLEETSPDFRKLITALDKGKIVLAVNIPPDFSDKIYSGRSSPLQVMVDGTDNNTATVSSSYIEKMVQDKNFALLKERLNKAGKAALFSQPLKVEPRVWYNPDLKSVNFMIPALIGMLLLMLTLNATSVSLVKEWERGTMEQLMVTPLKPWELIIGKILPFLIIIFTEVLLVVAVGVIWFKVPLRGDFLLLLFLSGIFLLTSLGLGILISTISRTQQEAMFTAFFFIMPNFWLSGFIFPIDSMPKIFQYITYLIPLRYYLVIIRGIFMKGIGFAYLWDEALMLLIFGVVVMGVSLLRYKRSLD